jgi:uncharacterized protein (TIGR03067 family)
MNRVIVALVALVGLTAFAPAPLPRPPLLARGDHISLRHFQGKWHQVRIENIEPNGERKEWKNANVVAVRVKGDQWIYLGPNDRVNATYTLTVQEARGPAAIDWYSGGNKGQLPFMLGLIKRDGDTIQVLGKMGPLPGERPKRFEGAPAGWWLMTLQRAK